MNEFEVKSTRVDVLSLVLKSQDIESLKEALVLHFSRVEDIDSMPFLLDLQYLPDAWSLRLDLLLPALRELGLNVIGIRHTDKTLGALAAKYNLAFSVLKDGETKPAPQVEEIPPLDEWVNQTMVIDKPVRSGQQIYAENTDLIVTAMVSEGAEVIADGHIHVYAPMRGRILAGASGDRSARIFIQENQAQLISIAGIYRTFDQKLPEALNKKPVMVCLEQDRLAIKALN